MAPYRWGARMEAMGTSRRRRRDCRICPEMLIAQAFTAIALVQLNTDQGNPVGSFTHREPCSAVKLYKHAPQFVNPRHGRLMLKSLASLSHAALIALISLVISGCHKERSYPVYRENPVPADALPIIIRVHDAPLEIPTPKVSVTYQIDPLCLPDQQLRGCAIRTEPAHD